jgi:hypothetical protein
MTKDLLKAYKELSTTKNMTKRREKRGQVTLFIILALLIGTAGTLYFILTNNEIRTDNNSGGLRFEGCVQDAIEQHLNTLYKGGGDINPQFTKRHKGEEIKYLCYTDKDYDLCTVQQPFLLQTIKENLHILLEQNINECYTNSITQLKEEGLEVTPGKLSYTLDIQPGAIIINIKAPTSIGNQQFTSVNVRHPSEAYDMITLANSILRQEASLGDSGITNFRLLYPKYSFKKEILGDYTKIYSIREKRDSNTKTIKFAIRGRVLPAGYQ